MSTVSDEIDQATVLVVDDDPDARQSLEFLIRSVGLNIRSYASATDFLASPDLETAGCLVLDLRMPGMSGLELQDQLNEMNVGIPIILLTAYAEVPIAVKAMKAGAIDVIQKPYSQQVLLDRIQQALARDRANRQTGSRCEGRATNWAGSRKGERDVLERLRAGMSNKEIAGELGLTRRGIEARRANIMRKLRGRFAGRPVANGDGGRWCRAGRTGGRNLTRLVGMMLDRAGNDCRHARADRGDGGGLHPHVAASAEARGTRGINPRLGARGSVWPHGHGARVGQGRHHHPASAAAEDGVRHR